MASGLSRLDRELCASLPQGARVHDRRERTLATKADGTWFGDRKPAPDGPKRLEVKAVAAT